VSLQAGDSFLTSQAAGFAEVQPKNGEFDEAAARSFLF
jgi:hypothetical protein